MVISKYVPLLVPRIKAEPSAVATAEFTPLPEQTVRAPLIPSPREPNERGGGVTHAVLGLVMGQVGDTARRALLDEQRDATRSIGPSKPIDGLPGE